MRMDSKEKSLKEKVFTGLIWTFGERIASQGVSFILSIILARLLLPEEYGIVAMVMVFISIAEVFTTGGFGEALIQKRKTDEVDFSTMFYCTFFISILIYVFLFCMAPFIANFYSQVQIIKILRILGIKIVISSISTIQRAYVSKYMIFKRLFFSTLGGTIISGFAGIVMALRGWGVWALVVQYLTNEIVNIVILFITVPWKPKYLFSIESAKELLKFGWKMVMANFINTIYNELRSLIIGKRYSSTDLAFYNKGNQIPSLAITNIDTAIGNVMFPAMTKASNRQQLKTIGRRAMKTTSYIIFPLMIGLIVIAKPLITIILTKKWVDSAIYMQILCVYWMTQPMQTTNWQMIKALGRSDICLKLEILKKAIGIILIVISMNYGVKMIAVSAAVFGIISMIINIVPNKKLVGYSFVEQMKDVFPSLILAILMGMTMGIVEIFLKQIWGLLIVQIIIGSFVYIMLSIIFKIEAMDYLLQVIKKFAKR